jgi:hypothetical protein
MVSLDHERGLFEALQKVGSKPPEQRPADVRSGDPTEVVEDVGHEKEEHTSTIAASPSSVTAQNLFRHPEAHPLVLDLVLLRKYGHEWLDWEPETLELVIPHDFATANVSDLNLSKINACKALHLVDSFWQRWEVFTWCAMPFNGVFPDFVTQQVPTVAQMLVAVDIANRIREDVAWSPELVAFMTTVYRHDGILVPVPPVDFFTIETDAVNVEDVDKRWPEVRRTGKAPGGDTVEDEQLRRLLIVTQYLEENRTRLRHQMELVPHV